MKWYSTPSPNVSPYIFLGLDPSPPPLVSVSVETFAMTCETDLVYTVYTTKSVEVILTKTV